MPNQNFKGSDLDRSERFRLEEAMIQFGGHFVKSLGQTMRYADDDNFKKLIKAFPEAVTMYGPNSVFYRSINTQSESYLEYNSLAQPN